MESIPEIDIFSEVPFDKALFCTPEEYLLRECTALDRHEYYNGKIDTTPGASKKNIIIAYNINKSLITELSSDYFVFG